MRPGGPDRGLAFKVYVQPRASKNQIVGRHGDALKIKLKAPPVEGAANKMCVRFLAECLGLPKSKVEIKSGHSSRTKLLLATPREGSDREKERRRLDALIQSWMK
ncbi:MAG: DUF167 domain-containing protein [Deltaproteobacteria bacterium]|nr:DUF167 domain-containing protein [Deltaproteobacteria bacterium]